MVEAFLKKAQQKGEPIEVYAKVNYPERFWVGYIVALNHEHIMFSLISPDGHYDGLLLRRVREVYRASGGTLYLNKIKRLSEESKTAGVANFSTSEDLVRGLLCFAQKNQYIISIEFDDDEIDKLVGVVTNLTEENGEILQIDEYGRRSTVIKFAPRDIAVIVCNDEEQQAIRRIYRGKEKNSE